MKAYRNANEALRVLSKDILDTGKTRSSRNGEMRELLMQSFTIIRPDNRYITLTGRNVSLPAQIAETMWILAGRNDIKWLSNYLPRAKDFSDDGLTWRGGYGPRIRNIGIVEDPLENVVAMLKEDPDTRRAVISIYNTDDDLAVDSNDIPCNNWLHFIIRDGRLHLNVATRSNDLFWGWSGINQFEWSALLEIVAGLVGVEVGHITYNITSLHLYEHHYERAAKLRYARWTGSNNNLPRFYFDEGVAEFDQLVDKWFRIEEMIREEPRGSAWGHIAKFPEPMLRSWLACLYAWWHGDATEKFFLDNPSGGDLIGTTMLEALKNSPKRKVPKEESKAAHPSNGTGYPEPDSKTVLEHGFLAFVENLHAEKHAVYGDSWKKRGEQIGIMANIARKIDRLGEAGAGDTAADTVIDLLVYLVKYCQWLREDDDGPEGVRQALRRISNEAQGKTFTPNVRSRALKYDFDALERFVTQGYAAEHRYDLAWSMAARTYQLAEYLWEKEHEWKAGNADRAWKGYENE